jgi:TolB protein
MRTVAGLVVAVALIVGCGGDGVSGDLIGFDTGGSVFVMNSDGTDLRALLEIADEACPGPERPVWSPDGERIAVQVGRGFCVMNANGTDARHLGGHGVIFPGVGTGLSWSPDGDRIAFDSYLELSDGSGVQVFVMNADGTDLHQITDGLSGIANAMPSWSPDGEHIAFVSWRDGEAEIFVMNTGGGEIRQLTDNDVGDVVPSWSPDGKHIAFVTFVSNTSHEIFVMNSDGTDLRQLTDNDHSDHSPSWSPDGKRIAFASNRYHSHEPSIYEIFVMDADGMNVYSTGQVGTHPSWVG